MTEKKSLFIRYGLLADLMLGLIAFLTVQSAQMFVMYGYITALSMRFRFMLVPLIYVFAFLYLRRLRIKQKYMIGAHVGFIVLSGMVISKLMGANGYEMTGVISSAVIQGIYSMKQRYRIEDFVVKSDILYLAITVNVITFLVISYHKKADFISLVLINTVLVVVFFFVARQSNVLDVAYYHSLRSETQNVNSVKRQNRLSMIVIVLGIAVSLFLLYVFPVDSVTNAIIAFITAVLRFLFQFLPNGEPYEPTPPEELDINMPQQLPDSGESLILKIIVTIVFLAVVVGFFSSLVMGIRSFLARFNVASDEPAVDSDGAVVDLIENVTKAGKNSKSSLDFGKGYEKEVRKKFYHKVKKGMKAGLPIGRTSSPRQIEKVLASNGDASISSLTDSYEKIRYGNKDLT